MIAPAPALDFSRAAFIDYDPSDPSIAIVERSAELDQAPAAGLDAMNVADAEGVSSASVRSSTRSSSTPWLPPDLEARALTPGLRHPVTLEPLERPRTIEQIIEGAAAGDGCAPHRSKPLIAALQNLGALIKLLPNSELNLTNPGALDAWRLILREEPRTYLALFAPIRVKCGKDVVALIQQLVAEPTPAGHRELRLLTAADLLAQPAPQWLVHERWPERGLAVIYGESQAGKTFITLDGALAVARGAVWFGRKTQAGGVIYVAAEGRLRDRLEAYKIEHGLSNDDFSGFRAIEESVDLSGATRDLHRLTERVTEAAESIGNVSLVVVDTVARAMAGSDENSGQDMGAFIAACRQIEDACSGLVLCVHHSGKDVTRGARGHSSLRAATDAEMEVTVDKPSGIRTAAVTKLRDGPDGETMSYRLKAVRLGPAGRPSCVVERSDAAPDRRKDRVPSGVAKVALRALEEALGEHGIDMPGSTSIPPGVKAVKLDQWRDRFGLRYGTDGETGKRAESTVRQGFKRGREALLRSETVQISDPYVWLSR